MASWAQAPWHDHLKIFIKVMILNGRVEFSKKKYWFGSRGVTVRLTNPDKGFTYFLKSLDLQSKITTVRWRSETHRRQINRYLSSSSLTGSFENIYKSDDFRRKGCLFKNKYLEGCRGVTVRLINPDRGVTYLQKSWYLPSKINTFKSVSNCRMPN